MQTFGDESHFAFAAVTQNHAEFVACGASDNVAAAQGLRQSLAGGDDHFVGGIKTVGLVDDRKLIDGSDKICARALFNRCARDDSGQLLAQPGAVEVARQFVAACKIIEPDQGVLLLGDRSHHSGYAFSPAVPTRQPHRADLEPFARRFASRFEFERERRIRGRGLIDEAEQAALRLGSKPGAQTLSRCQTFRLGMPAQHGVRAVPRHVIVGDGPIEHRDLTTGERQAQPFRVARLPERVQAALECLLKILTPHDLHPPWSRSLPRFLMKVAASA